MFEKIKQFHTGRPWTARLITAFLILFLVIIAARIALSPAIIYGAKSWLKKQGIASYIEAVQINIFDGTVSLLNARGSKDGKPVFNIGLVDIHWEWRPLSNKTIVVTKVALDEIDVDIKQYNDAIVISGITVPLGDDSSVEDKAVEVDDDVKSWAASLGGVAFTNLDVCYAQYATSIQQASDTKGFIDYCARLDELLWQGTIGYATDSELVKAESVPVSSTGDFAFSGLSVIDNRLGRKLLVSQSNSLEGVTISGLDKLHIDLLDMEALSLLQRNDDRHVDALRFNRLQINDITLSKLDSLAIASISVSAPGVYLVRLNQTDWEYQPWIPAFPDNTESQKVAAQSAQTEASAFRVSLDELAIKDSDLCYLDKVTALYYCLTIADLGWKGPVKYSTEAAGNGEINLQVTGDFELTRPVIHNQNLDRDLLNFASLKLSGVDVDGIDSVTLKGLALKQLNALQRSAKHDDNTVSFDELAINDIKYSTNSIAINTIDLNGIASIISMDKDGKPEYEKWFPAKENDEVKKEETTESKTNADDANTQPFNIALNKLSINSDRNLMFKDDSTQPAMEIGLNDFGFDISKLNSAKPQTDSPFSLKAKTTRHGTLDLAGTVRPFADKLSLDAKGKLKGIDLRALSPEVRKAIGHIIQSGQLDAELDLKAVKGELDSNIALSLYQFQMKSVSKDDAKKLDDKFGMPLNQALKLLRDKDDSIHLNLPVTGDVNNPEFDPMDAIVKATTKATQETLITFFTPYGLIYQGGKLALNLATALNFDPVLFAPGSAELTADGKKQLDNMSKLLTEKPQIHLTMCGMSNQQDTLVLFPEPKTGKAAQSETTAKDKVDTAQKPLTDEQIARLRKLASDRQNNSKDYLVTQHGIDHSRLILCEPEHNTEADAIAGVEINI